MAIMDKYGNMDIMDKYGNMDIMDKYGNKMHWLASLVLDCLLHETIGYIVPSGGCIVLT